MFNSMKKIFLILLFFPAISGYGQRNITRQQVIWYGYYFTAALNEKWYWQTELHERHFINPNTQFQLAFRSHIHRVLGNGLETSAGMCLFLSRPNDPELGITLAIPELRPHAEIAYKQKIKFLTLDHRVRTEARYFHFTNAAKTALERGYYFGAIRFRYQLQATIPIWKMDEQRSMRTKIGGEILLNTRNKYVHHSFDQARIHAGWNIDLLPTLNFELVYLYQFQQKSTEGYFKRDILRVNLFQKINFKKIKSKSQ